MSAGLGRALVEVGSYGYSLNPKKRERDLRASIKKGALPSQQRKEMNLSYRADRRRGGELRCGGESYPRSVPCAKRERGAQHDMKEGQEELW